MTRPTHATVGIFGLGRMGRLHARVLREMPEAYVVVGFCDPDAAAHAPGLERLDERTLLARSDVVIVASPASAHVTIARGALALGRTVFVEKPLSNTASSARALLEEHASGQLFVGHSERFNPVVRALHARLRELAARGELVRELAIESVVNGLRQSTADDALMNLGVHDFDLVEHLTGKRAVVLGAEGDARASHVHLSVGAAFVTMRAAREGEPTRRVRVVTERFRFEGDLLAHRLVCVDRASARETSLPLPTEEPLRAQAEALHRASVRETGGAGILATGVEGLRAVELAELAVTLRDHRIRGISAASAAV